MITFQDGGSQARISFKYDPDVIALIKGFVPSQVRRFDNLTKSWVVDLSYARHLAEKLVADGYSVNWPSEGFKIEPTKLINDFWDGKGGHLKKDEKASELAVKILEDIEPERHGAVLRAMAKILYPDLYTKKKK